MPTVAENKRRLEIEEYIKKLEKCQNEVIAGRRICVGLRIEGKPSMCDACPLLARILSSENS